MLFLKILFFALLGVLSTSLFVWLRKTAFLLKIKHLITLDNKISTDTWSMYRDSSLIDMWNTMSAISVASFQRYPTINCDIFIWKKAHFGIIVGKAVLLLTIYYSYVIADMETMFFENFALKLGSFCKTTAVICLFSHFLSKWIWKTVYYFCPNLPKMERRSKL